MSKARRVPGFRAWAPHPLRLRDRLAARLAAEGRPWPEFAADVLAWRGTTGRTRTELAAEIDVAEAEIVAAETGELDPDEAAPALRWGARRHLADLRKRHGDDAERR